MYGEVVNSSEPSSRPVDLSVFMRGEGVWTQDRDRHFSAGVPASAYRTEGVPLGPVASAETAELRANPDRTSHPLAAQVAFRLMVENGEL